MIQKFKITFILLIIGLCEAGCLDSSMPEINTKADAKKIELKIILGSTRKGRMSEKIGIIVKSMLDKRSDVNTEIVDLRDYELPFLDDEIPPASREKITDPRVQRWSDVIASADAFIIISPEYNAGYPGVLKNALDTLFKEWNHKPVGIIGYSGGSSGGASMIAQLKQVAQALEMVPVEMAIKIPTSWKAFDEKRNLVNSRSIEAEFNTMMDQISKAIKN